MSNSDSDDPVPQTLLTIPTEYQSTIPKTSSSQPLIQKTPMATTNLSLFDTPLTEMKFRQRVMEQVRFYNGDPDLLSDWLRDTGIFFAKDCVPNAHQIFFFLLSRLSILILLMKI